MWYTRKLWILAKLVFDTAAQQYQTGYQYSPTQAFSRIINVPYTYMNNVGAIESCLMAFTVNIQN